MISDFDALRRFLSHSSGLSLDADKAYLAESRLAAIIERTGCADLGQLMRRLNGGADPELSQEIIDAMMTNETFFFRDRLPFDSFRKIILPQLLEARRNVRRLRIWCCACSRGQEPYSLAMIIDEEAQKLTGWNVEILATDLSRSVLAGAREGLYSQFEVQRGLPISYLLRYFRQEGDRWRINEHLRSRVRFEELNLMSDFRRLGRFDVIFCRNVLIYFDVPTKKNVLGRLVQALPPDGYFLMGAAETVVGLTDALVPHAECRSINVPRGQGGLLVPLQCAAG
ncbi:MAG: CheR family methyltransferase [Beijerinckiaceae bacterium]